MQVFFISIYICQASLFAFHVYYRQVSFLFVSVSSHWYCGWYQAWTHKDSFHLQVLYEQSGIFD